MIRIPRGDLALLLSVSIPAITPKNRAYEPYIEKLDFYRRFLAMLGLEDRFNEVAGEIYNAMLEGERVRERDYRRVLDALGWEVEKGVTEIIMSLREAGARERADFLDKYLMDRDYHVIYRILVGTIQSELETIDQYREILNFFNSEERFRDIAGDVFSRLKARTWVDEATYRRVEKALREEVERRIKARIAELRDAGYGREADKVEEFLKNGDYENAYFTLRGIREVKRVEVEEFDAREFMRTYLESYRIIDLLSRAGVDVEDIKWKVGEIMRIGAMKLPDDRVILINDPYGNAACYLSLYLRRIGERFTFFSTSGIGDYWITDIDVENRVSPTLQASKLGEKILSSEGMVVLEDINYLILSNKFSEVYRFLYYIKNNLDDRIVLTANLKMLSDRERARLQGIADRIIDVEVPLNICSANLVAVESRPREGALLLSKERVEDFPGQVYIISDFGGENTLHPQRIDFEILDKIAEYLDRGNVVIDALDMLIDENGIEKIYLWLKSVRDVARKRGRMVYVVTRDLVASERNFFMPLVDFDSFVLASMDRKRLAVMQKEMKTVRRILEKRVEKECVYTLEIIKNRFQRYRKYLSDLEEDIEKLRSIGTYDVDCIVKISPIKREIERRVEEIENITSEFSEKMDRINSLMPVLQVYVDVSDLEECVLKAKRLIDSGNYVDAMYSLGECESLMERLHRRALSRAWDKREEIMCVSYLLPPHLREKVEDFEGEREKLKDFTLLYMAVRNLLARKILNEHEKLRRYADLASLDLFEVRDFIKEERYCDYSRARKEFLERFNEKRGEISRGLMEKIDKAVEFLGSRGYDVQGIEIPRGSEDVDSLLDISERVAHHLIRYVENYFTNLRDRCPRCIGDEELAFLEEFRKRPLDMLDPLREVLGRLDEKSEKEIKMLQEMTRELESYYDILDEYDVDVEKVYPATATEARAVLNAVRNLVQSLTPSLDIHVENWFVDENRMVHAFFDVINKDRFPARNITMEVHGAFSHNVKVAEIPPGEHVSLEVVDEVRDPDSMVDVDIVYEGPGGNIATRSFRFKLNLRGYFVKKAKGTEKCSYCRGKIFRDTDMAICSKCGATYHVQCARRAGRCKICGNVFLTSEG